MSGPFVDVVWTTASAWWADCGRTPESKRSAPYYAAKARPTSRRWLCDEELKVEIARVHEGNFGVYRIEKV
jgi:hypothetical protein